MLSLNSFSSHAPLTPLNLSDLLLSLAAFLPLYLLTLALYRLYLHPCHSIPGPRLAALTYWYEFYHDVWPRRGRFIFHIQDLHRKYGPIVRINPNEVHINDPHYFDVIYHSDARKKTNRDAWYNLDFLGEGLAFTKDHDVHALRKSALAGYFSQRSVNRLEERIVRVMEGLIARFQADIRGERRARPSGSETKWAIGEYEKRMKEPPGVENMYHLGSAVAFDIVTDYAFGSEGCTNFMDREDAGREWCKMTQEQVKNNPFSRQFKWIMWLMVHTPVSLLLLLNPAFAIFIRYQEIIVQRTQQVMDEVNASDKADTKAPTKHKENTGETTVFHELVTSDLPPAEKSLSRLTDEAGMIVGAGGETTAQVICRTFYHILNNPESFAKLHKELVEAIPDAKVMPTLQTLQSLPYLSAVVEEGVRIAMPIPARSPRIFPDQDLQYKQWVIPRGNAVSTSPYVVSTNEEVFPEPFKFRPERWLGDSGRELLKYAVTFGRGRRSCLGKSLAYAELLFTIAVSFRRFEFELFETTERDVRVEHDFFIGLPVGESQGVRVRVLKELD